MGKGVARAGHTGRMLLNGDPKALGGSVMLIWGTCQAEMQQGPSSWGSVPGRGEDSEEDSVAAVERLRGKT